MSQLIFGRASDFRDWSANTADATSSILNSIIVCILLISVFSILHFSVFCIFLYTFVIGEQTDMMHGAVVGVGKQTVNRELKRQEIVQQTLPMFAFY